jgi:hypothetical protein
MFKTDTVLQLVGITAIAAIGIPVAFSVKFRDGTVTATEIHEVFGVHAWKINLATPTRFSTVDVRVESVEGNTPEVVSSLKVPFDKGSKFADVGVFVRGTNVRVRCAGQESVGTLTKGELSSDAKPYRLGGKGKESGAGTFLLVVDGPRVIRVVIEVD